MTLRSPTSAMLWELWQLGEPDGRWGAARRAVVRDGRGPAARARVARGPHGPQMGVDVVQRDAAGDHHHLDVVEQLGDLLGGGGRALVLGGHPHLGGLLDDLLADRVDAGVQQRDRPGAGRSLGRADRELREEVLEGLHAATLTSARSAGGSGVALMAAPMRSGAGPSLLAVNGHGATQGGRR